MMRLLAPVFLLLLVACAQVRELQGGEKDTVAPMLLAAEPPNGTVRFREDRIVLKFNERVKLDRVRERLLISPPLDKSPDVSISAGQEVVLALRAPLAPNTTYTFNIGEAVTDITEGNVAAGLTYVISTGDVLDSLSISGVVLDAFTAKPEPDVLVVLHTDTDSTGFTAGRPAYFTRTDEGGAYSLRNLREGQYRLHALKDQNANFRNDLPNERVAFADSLADAQDSATHVLRMFLPLAATQQVKEAAVQPDRSWRIVLARPVDTLLSLTSIDRIGGDLDWSWELNATNDTILFWPSDTTLLAGQRFRISDATGVFDTLTYRPTRKMPFNLDVKTARLADGEPAIIPSRPLERTDLTRAFLRMDSMEAPVSFSRFEGTRLLAVQSALLDGRSATLVLLPGTFTDIYGGRNDTLRLSLGGGTVQQTGDLKVNLTLDSTAGMAGPFFLQVLTPQGGVQRTVPVPTLPFQATLAGTPAGVYTLKLVADTDGDGRWSTGSLRDKRQPERVFRQQGEVNVRAGWEVVVDWSVEDR